MSSSPKRILIIEDNREVRLAALFVLEAFGYRVCEVENPVQAKQWLEANQADIILLDMNFDLDSTSGEEGLGFLRWKQQQAIANTAGKQNPMISSSPIDTQRASFL